jgi:hypothetical protein
MKVSRPLPFKADEKQLKQLAKSNGKARLL